MSWKRFFLNLGTRSQFLLNTLNIQKANLIWTRRLEIEALTKDVDFAL